MKRAHIDKTFVLFVFSCVMSLAVASADLPVTPPYEASTEAGSANLVNGQFSVPVETGSDVAVTVYGSVWGSGKHGQTGIRVNGRHFSVTLGEHF